MNFLVLQRRRYLNEHLPLRCICGVELTIAREIQDHRFEGVETEPCVACGALPIQLKTHRCAKDMARAAAGLRGMWEDACRPKR